MNNLSAQTNSRLKASFETAISPPVLGGIGSTFVSSPTAPHSSKLFVAILIWGIVQEYRVQRNKESPSTTPHKNLSLLQSPGIFAIACAGGFCSSAIESSLIKKEFLSSLAFVAFVIGELGVTHLVDPQCTKRCGKLIYRTWHSLSQRISARTKNILADPGPWFGLGNLIVNQAEFLRIPPSELTIAALSLNIFSIVIMAASVMQSLRVWLKSETSSGQSSLLTGCGDLLFATALLSINGHSPIGLAALFYGLANLSIGRRQRGNSGNSTN